MESAAGKRHPRFVRGALMFGIVVVLNVSFSVMLSLALPTPTLDHFCPLVTQSAPLDAATCDARGGIWSDTTSPAQSAAKATSGYCDVTAACDSLYQSASEQHALYAFILLTILGIAALVIGLLPLGASTVSGGLSYGGVLALIIASAAYWGTAGNWLRLCIATAALTGLLTIGVRQFKD